MGVAVHVGSHPDALVATLAERLRADPLDPFTSEIIAVPTRGIERWLTQRIALELADVAGGIAANIEFPSPQEFIRHMIGQLPELSASFETWEGPAFRAAVMAVIDDELHQPWMVVLRRHLAATTSSRMAAAAKISRLFVSYARRRPTMISSWAAGGEVGPSGEALDDHQLWQPRLWRALRERIGLPSVPELGLAALGPLWDGGADLPKRLSVYGLTATDPFDLAVFEAVGRTTDVHLHVLHPSPALWEAVAGHGAVDLERGADTSVREAAHPLLRSWGRDSRELQLVLSEAGLTGAGEHVHLQATPAPVPVSLLGRLQADIRDNQPASHAPLDPMDRSVQIHVCHGARRQVEVLRDAILHILADDPTIEPRDVVIMTPDLAGFAPLLEAGFPQAGSDVLPDLRVRIADRSPSATNPLVRFGAGILDLADSRLEAAAVRELVTRPIVQNRFGFDADTAGSIVRIIDDATIAWGLDADHRRKWGIEDIAERTWRRGLDRALAGVFYTDSPVRVVGDVAPLDGVEGQDARPVGILAAIIDRVTAISARLSETMPLSEWAAAIAASTRMLADPGWDDEWQWNQLERLLTETFPRTDAADPPVTLAEARQAMKSWTDDRPSPLMFRTGDVTVCTLVPMRSVPYRVVCLLGMDDDRFPRRGRSDGDDLLVGHERVGDHARPSEDRQLLLDAVMAAGDHLVVTYSGRDEITNAEYPPAVPISELGDVLSAMTGRPIAELETRHPLQSFSEAVFTPEALGVTGPWGFDPIQLAGAHAVQRRMQPSLDMEVPWPPRDPPDVVRLSDLHRFLTNPVRGFVRASLGFGIPDVAELADDAVPVELGGLQSWALKDRLIEGLARGHDLESLLARERGADALPPARLAEREIDKARTDVEALWTAAVGRGYHRAHHRRYTGSLNVNGRLVEGSVIADPRESHLPLITPSRIKASHRLRSFVELCFLTALEPEHPWHALMLTRQARGRGFLEVTIGPLGTSSDERRSKAMQLLWGLVSLYDDGHRAPMPLPCETGLAWQRKAVANRTGATWDARDKFERDRFSAERRDSAHELVYGKDDTLERLLSSGFEEHCRRLWEPIIPLMKDVGL